MDFEFLAMWPGGGDCIQFNPVDLTTILVLIGMGGDGGAVTQDPAPPPPAPPEPSCSISLYDRPAGFAGNPFMHSYLDVTDPNLAQFGLAPTSILEGGPDGSAPGPFGFLAPNISPIPNAPLAGVGTSSNTSEADNHQIGQSYSQADACADIEYMIMMINNYKAGPGVPYWPTPGVLAPTPNARNSNSFTYTLLGDTGLQTTFTNGGGLFTFWHPGWGMSVPGL